MKKNYAYIIFRHLYGILDQLVPTKNKSMSIYHNSIWYFVDWFNYQFQPSYFFD